MLEKIVLVPDHCLSFYFKMFHGIQIIAPVSGNCSKYLVSCEVCVKVFQTINEPSQKSRNEKKKTKKNATNMDRAMVNQRNHVLRQYSKCSAGDAHFCI